MMLLQRETPRQSKGEQPEQAPSVPQSEAKTKSACPGKGAVLRIGEEIVLCGLAQRDQGPNEEDPKSQAPGPRGLRRRARKRIRRYGPIRRRCFVCRERASRKW